MIKLLNYGFRNGDTHKTSCTKTVIHAVLEVDAIVGM